MTRTRKTEDPVLRAEIRKLRAAGMPVPRRELAARYGVGQHTIQLVRNQIEHEMRMGIEQDPMINEPVAEGCQVNVWKILSDNMTRLRNERDIWTPMSLAQAYKIERQLADTAQLLRLKQQQILQQKGMNDAPADYDEPAAYPDF